MNIITGSTGYEHVTADQDAMWHRGIGTDTCVFDVGEKFQPQIISNSSVRVKDGICSLQGRYMCIDIGSYEDVEISNGSQGVGRIDIICGKITINGSGISRALLEVIQGTSSSSPVEPTIPNTNLDDGDLYAYIPLVKVELNGINIVSATMIGELYAGGRTSTRVCALAANGWVASGNYYVQTVTVNRIIDDNPIWTPCDSTGTGFPASEQYNYVDLARKSGDNSITFRANAKPTVTLYALVKGVQ